MAIVGHAQDLTAQLSSPDPEESGTVFAVGLAHHIQFVEPFTTSISLIVDIDTIDIKVVMRP